MASLIRACCCGAPTGCQFCTAGVAATWLVTFAGTTSCNPTDPLGRYPAVNGTYCLERLNVGDLSGFEYPGFPLTDLGGTSCIWGYREMLRADQALYVFAIARQTSFPSVGLAVTRIVVTQDPVTPATTYEAGNGFTMEFDTSPGATVPCDQDYVGLAGQPSGSCNAATIDYGGTMDATADGC